MISSCVNRKVFDSEYYCQKLSLNCTRENQRVAFKTSKGNFEVQLYGKNNPVTVTNFIENIKKEIYKNKKFYKIVNYPQIQVIHSGVFSENNYYKKDSLKLNNLSPTIPLEIKLDKEIEPRYKYQVIDPSEIQNLTNIFEKGSLAMVRSGESSSSSTEFFFVTNKFPELNGRYSIFGKVIKGYEILKKIDKKDLIYDVLISP